MSYINENNEENKEVSKPSYVKTGGHNYLSVDKWQKVLTYVCIAICLIALILSIIGKAHSTNQWWSLLGGNKGTVIAGHPYLSIMGLVASIFGLLLLIFSCFGIAKDNKAIVITGLSIGVVLVIIGIIFGSLSMGAHISLTIETRDGLTVGTYKIDPTSTYTSSGLKEAINKNYVTSMGIFEFTNLVEAL